MEKKKMDKYKKLSIEIEKLMEEDLYGEIKVTFEKGHPMKTTIVSNKKY